MEEDFCAECLGVLTLGAGRDAGFVASEGRTLLSDQPALGYLHFRCMEAGGIMPQDLSPDNGEGGREWPHDHQDFKRWVVWELQRLHEVVGREVGTRDRQNGARQR